MDNTTIHPSSAHFAYLVDLHLWRGAPENSNRDRPVEILINHGYVVGFSPTRLQPAWSAYRVAHADQDVDFDRPHLYYDDVRLPVQHRIGAGTFGTHGGVRYHVGHMTPNEVINRQFGRLAQMETFLMSNMSPQRGSLNTGVWGRLERAIREIEDTPDQNHVWAIVGPVFGDHPDTIDRGDDRLVPIPEAYFCVIVDPQRYPWDRDSNVLIDCFLLPQDAPAGSQPRDYLTDLPTIQDRTGLRLFPTWGRDMPVGLRDHAARGEQPKSRLMRILEANADTTRDIPPPAVAPSRQIDHLIAALRSEAEGITNRTDDRGEGARWRTLQEAIAYLVRALGLLSPPPIEPESSTLITYKIEQDDDGKLKSAARTACNFWNRFLLPRQSIVIRLGLFTENSNTIARAYYPHEHDGTVYGRVQFNTKYLAQYTDDEIAGTIVHEIGHTLGIGWDDWTALFDGNTGKFTAAAIAKLPALEAMEVERDGGSGTELSHWDEEKFKTELMTGYKDPSEHVLPVTVDVMALLGHEISERLADKTPLRSLLRDSAGLVFSRHGDAKRLDVDHFKQTDVFETIPHDKSKRDA